jgi:hypothetical protein
MKTWLQLITALACTSLVACASGSSSTHPGRAGDPRAQEKVTPGDSTAAVGGAGTAGGEVRLERVTFPSEGETLVGVVYLPAGMKPGEKLPLVIVAGSWTTVKEQMAGLYAQRLAEAGIPAMTFDFRFFGESGGQPRQYESPEKKIQDIQNAVRFARTLPFVDSKRLGGLGVCASAGYMAHAIARGAPLKSFATVAAWMHDARTVRSLYGGEAGVRRRLQAGEAARARYEKTGEVEYVPAHSSTDERAAMVSPLDYYSKPSRGAIPQWTNRFTVMSWPEWLRFDALEAAPKVRVPTLFVHTDESALPDNVGRFAAAMPGPKDLFWIEGQHLDFYDREPYVTKAVAAVADHFERTLRRSGPSSASLQSSRE